MEEVWILHYGEDYNGGSILAVFSTRELAMNALVDRREVILERYKGMDLADVTEISKDEFRVMDNDWYAIDSYRVIVGE